MTQLRSATSRASRGWTNVTGVLFLHRELTAKRIELFKEILPTVNRVSVLSDLRGRSTQGMEAANRSMGLKLQVLQLRNPSYDFESAFRIAMRARAEALYVLTTQSFSASARRSLSSP
jgi:ABC-type uncharacterized transport system substrate-binding protein